MIAVPPSSHRHSGMPLGKSSLLSPSPPFALEETVVRSMVSPRVHSALQSREDSLDSPQPWYAGQSTVLRTDSMACTEALNFTAFASAALKHSKKTGDHFNRM
eukprot:5390091-Amphidinium_carterae.1